MAERQNKFAGARPSKTLLHDLTDQINASNKSVKTKRRVEDIDIDLIDTDEVNEELFGYEDLYKIEESIETIGNKSVIFVYERPDGRYLCYAGNQRLIASKRKGEKTITCVIDGPEPEKQERIEQYIFMNAQRSPRPYYIAQQLKAYENILRSRGVKDVPKTIEQKFGYKVRMQQIYKQILTLTPELQSLFKHEGIQMKHLLDVCSMIPEDKKTEFAEILGSKIKEEGSSTELINSVLTQVTENNRNNGSDESSSRRDTNKKVKKPTTGQTFKSIMTLPYYAEDEEITIPDDKKEVVLSQISELESYIKRLKKACK